MVLAYGTNESGDEQPMAAYEQQLVEALGRIASAAPSASCLLLGPPDRALKTAGAWRTAARLLAIVESQRKVAEAAGCAFFDQLEAMGGPGSMVKWASEAKPRARRDYVHLTREGYVELGEALGNELLRAYAAWRAEQAGPPRVARAE